MKAKEATQEEIKQAIINYEEKHHEGLEFPTVIEGEGDIYILKDKNGAKSVVGPGLTCENKVVLNELKELIMLAREGTTSPQAQDQAPKGMIPHEPRRSSSLAAQVQSNANATIRDIQVQDLTMQDIKAYICPDATEQEAFMFLKLCQARNLNPFTREAYLVKYGGKANMIVGKEAFTRKAEANPQFDGFRAGIIVKKGDAWEERDGSFLMPGEELLGGFAEVFRKDLKNSFKQMVSLKEYSKQQATWKDMPAVMIRKVALVSALREAFPSDLSGCYDASEIVQGAA